MPGDTNAMPRGDDLLSADGNHLPTHYYYMFGVARRHAMSDNGNEMSDNGNEVSDNGNEVSGHRDAMPCNTNTMPNFGANAVPGNANGLPCRRGNAVPDGDYTMSGRRDHLPNENGDGSQRAGANRCGGGKFVAKLGFAGGVCHRELVTRCSLAD